MKPHFCTVYSVKFEYLEMSAPYPRLKVARSGNMLIASFGKHYLNLAITKMA